MIAIVDKVPPIGGEPVSFVVHRLLSELLAVADGPAATEWRADVYLVDVAQWVVEAYVGSQKDHVSE